MPEAQLALVASGEGALTVCEDAHNECDFTETVESDDAPKKGRSKPKVISLGPAD